MTYPLSFRRKVLSVREREGLSIAAVSARFDVGVASVTRWLKTVEPKATRNKPATKIDMDALAQDVLDRPDAYHYERAKTFGVSVRTIGYALKRLGVTYKKSPASSQSVRRRTAHLSEPHRASQN